MAEAVEVHLAAFWVRWVIESMVLMRGLATQPIADEQSRRVVNFLFLLRMEREWPAAWWSGGDAQAGDVKAIVLARTMGNPA